MKKFLLVLLFSVAGVAAKAQLFVSCADTNQRFIYRDCGEDYTPVCACDGNTYRNACAAYYWGGVVSYNWVDGTCGVFDFDFVPNPIVPGTINHPGKLRIFSHINAIALVQIYDVYGRIWYVQPVSLVANASPNDFPLYIDMEGFESGIYYVFVSVNGEALHKKIMKSNQR